MSQSWLNPRSLNITTTTTGDDDVPYASDESDDDEDDFSNDSDWVDDTTIFPPFLLHIIDLLT